MGSVLPTEGSEVYTDLLDDTGELMPSRKKKIHAPTRVLEERLMRKADRARTETSERDELIQELRDRGLTLRQIGELASLSHTQIGNIIGREAA